MVSSPISYLKFNVDGFSLGKPSPAGISGVLRNANSDKLHFFFGSIGYADLNLAEYMAIKKAFTIFVLSKWLSSYDLIVESDNLNAVNWFNDNVLCLWRLKKFCLTIDLLKSAVIDWKVQHAFRECNEVADTLVKFGVFRTFNLLLVLS
ncbi:hypothetical protein REPUB_Repub10bG0066500 [Reevesia pubescens]